MFKSLVSRTLLGVVVLMLAAASFTATPACAHGGGDFLGGLIVGGVVGGLVGGHDHYYYCPRYYYPPVVPYGYYYAPPPVYVYPSPQPPAAQVYQQGYANGYQAAQSQGVPPAAVYPAPPPPANALPQYIPPAVSIPDANLQAAIRSALNKPAGAIVSADMASLTSLTAEMARISDLTGLQYAVNLQALDLDKNQISDITPLSGLTKVGDLDLSRNQIDGQRMIIQHHPAGIEVIVLIKTADDQTGAVVQRLATDFQCRRAVEQFTELHVGFGHTDCPSAINTVDAIK